MKSINEHPAKKQEPNKNSESAASSNTGEKGVYSDNDKSKNYKYGKDNPEGPDFDKSAEGAEGDTGQNAGVFK